MSLMIHLKTLAASNEPQNVSLTLSENLPAQLKSPCTLNCELTGETFKDYYLLNVNVNASLQLQCLRCLHDFPFEYSDTICLAACSNEETFTRLINDHDVVLEEGGQFDLAEFLTSELYLNLPESHPDTFECDKGIDAFISTHNFRSLIK